MVDEQVVCEMCDSPNLRLVTSDVMRCRDCSHVFSPIPEAAPAKSRRTKMSRADTGWSDDDEY